MLYARNVIKLSCKVRRRRRQRVNLTLSRNTCTGCSDRKCSCHGARPPARQLDVLFSVYKMMQPAGVRTLTPQQPIIRQHDRKSQNHLIKPPPPPPPLSLHPSLHRLSFPPRPGRELLPLQLSVARPDQSLCPVSSPANMQYPGDTYRADVGLPILLPDCCLSAN